MGARCRPHQHVRLRHGCLLCLPPAPVAPLQGRRREGFPQSHERMLRASAKNYRCNRGGCQGRAQAEPRAAALGARSSGASRACPGRHTIGLRPASPAAKYVKRAGTTLALPTGFLTASQKGGLEKNRCRLSRESVFLLKAVQKDRGIPHALSLAVESSRPPGAPRLRIDCPGGGAHPVWRGRAAGIRRRCRTRERHPAGPGGCRRP